MVPICRTIWRGDRNSQFSSVGRSSGIDWSFRHKFVKSSKPSSMRCSLRDVDYSFADERAAIGDSDDSRTAVFLVFDEHHCLERE